MIADFQGNWDNLLIFLNISVDVEISKTVESLDSRNGHGVRRR